MNQPERTGSIPTPEEGPISHGSKLELRMTYHTYIENVPDSSWTDIMKNVLAAEQVQGSGDD